MMVSTFRRSITTCVSLLQAQRGPRGRAVQQRISLKKKIGPRNPGIENRLAAMKKDNVEMESSPDLDFFEDSESDFYNVGSAYQQYKKEDAARKEMIDLKMIGQKYFDEQVPNFLTWSEKEQIRFLHRKDPNEWTPEYLAESFPTTPEGAKKLIKVVWKPASQSRIERHDASALRNWKELKEGTLEGVSPELRDHILKFTNRVIPPRQIEAEVATKALSLKDQKAVFEDKLEALSQTDKDEIIRKEPTPNTKHMTLGSLRTSISKSITDNAEVSVIDKLIVAPSDEITTVKDSNQAIQIDSKTSIQEYKPNAVQKQNVEISNSKQPYPERIRIPKKAYQRGVTYKVDDCFYDDDGRFLYRVPGLTKIHSNN